MTVHRWAPILFLDYKRGYTFLSQIVSMDFVRVEHFTKNKPAKFVTFNCNFLTDVLGTLQMRWPGGDCVCHLPTDSIVFHSIDPFSFICNHTHSVGCLGTFVTGITITTDLNNYLNFTKTKQQKYSCKNSIPFLLMSNFFNSLLNSSSPLSIQLCLSNHFRFQLIDLCL